MRLFLTSASTQKKNTVQMCVLKIIETKRFNQHYAKNNHREQLIIIAIKYWLRDWPWLHCIRIYFQCSNSSGDSLSCESFGNLNCGWKNFFHSKLTPLKRAPMAFAIVEHSQYSCERWKRSASSITGCVVISGYISSVYMLMSHPFCDILINWNTCM